MRYSLQIGAVLGLIPSLALAHTGQGEVNSLAAGLLHPLTGADHLLAMPAFVASMLAGGLLGLGGAALPMIEVMIAASVLVLSALVALWLRLPLLAALPIVVAFGLAHGMAHGAEAPGANFAAYALGFTGATMALHAVGMGLGRRLPQRWVQDVGAIAAAAGLGLIVG